MQDETIDLKPQEARKTVALQIERIFQKKIDSPISEGARTALRRVLAEVKNYILQP